jgi:hypothetical protein
MATDPTSAAQLGEPRPGRPSDPVAVEVWLLVHNVPYNDRRGRQRAP